MARATSPEPTEVELRILSVLWGKGASTARQVHDVLATQRVTNYSTTVKMLGVMREKGLVASDDSVRPQVWRALVTRDSTQHHMLGRLIEKVYDGCAKSVVLHALSASESSKDDLREIRELLDQLEEETR